MKSNKCTDPNWRSRTQSRYLYIESKQYSDIVDYKLNTYTKKYLAATHLCMLRAQTDVPAFSYRSKEMRNVASEKLRCVFNLPTILLQELFGLFHGFRRQYGAMCSR